eukprot:4534-Heterococcus_DN1.PRE.4
MCLPRYDDAKCDAKEEQNAVQYSHCHCVVRPNAMMHTIHYKKRQTAMNSSSMIANMTAEMTAELLLPRPLLSAARPTAGRLSESCDSNHDVEALSHANAIVHHIHSRAALLCSFACSSIYNMRTWSHTPQKRATKYTVWEVASSSLCIGTYLNALA